MKKTRPIRHYEELWEDMMQYTDFQSTEQIEKSEDLFKFFKQVDDDASSKGRRKVFFGNPMFRERMAQALNISQTTRKPIKSRTDKIIFEDRRIFKNFNTAKQNKAVVQVKGVKIFRSFIQRGEKKIPRWRNATGRFVKNPEKTRVRLTPFGK